jgi:hypothetical protein
MAEPRRKRTIEFKANQDEALKRLAEREELAVAALIRRIVVAHLAKDAARALRAQSAA